LRSFELRAVGDVKKKEERGEKKGRRIGERRSGEYGS
jgi:hypothetical protein